jgi:hypothetical protein
MFFISFKVNGLSSVSIYSEINLSDVDQKSSYNCSILSVDVPIRFLYKAITCLDKIVGSLSTVPSISKEKMNYFVFYLLQ